MKKVSLSNAKRKTWRVFSLYIRMRDCLHTTGDLDYGKCITCSRLVKRQEADAGHFISRRYNSTFFDEKNVSLQCKQCNLSGGQILEYRRQIIKRYGENADVELEDKAMETKKWTIDELSELAEIYKAKIKELENV